METGVTRKVGMEFPRGGKGQPGLAKHSCIIRVRRWDGFKDICENKSVMVTRYTSILLRRRSGRNTGKVRAAGGKTRGTYNQQTLKTR